MKRKATIAAFILTACILFSGCQDVSFSYGKLKEAMHGRSVTIQTYDTDSNIIDSIHGESVSLAADQKFATESQKSSVLNITVGGNQVEHVGSSLLLYEDGLTDVFTQYAQTVNIKNMDRSVPFINRLVNDMKNSFTGKSMVILIRSQDGKPLATFAGDHVSIFSTDSDKTTALLVDGKYLVIYRCDYTIYDTVLLESDK